MILYSVTIKLVAPKRKKAILDYLRDDHIPALVRQPGFIGAELRQLERDVLVVDYRVLAPADLKRYLKYSAAGLRADFQARHGGEVELGRATSTVLCTFEKVGPEAARAGAGARRSSPARGARRAPPPRAPRPRSPRPRR
jgi:hypothetical protein